jgi:hypothetical protein
MRLTPIAVLPVLLALVAAAPTLASLGGGVDSVESDRLHLKGAVSATAAGTYTVHEITTSYGTTLREFAGADGKVFALSWSGPVYPELQQVLGSYYSQFAQAAATTRSTRRHLDVEQPGLVVQNSGRLRAFSGRAWVPGLLPPNFSVDDIR